MCNLKSTFFEGHFLLYFSILVLGAFLTIEVQAEKPKLAIHNKKQILWRTNQSLESTSRNEIFYSISNRYQRREKVSELNSFKH